VAGPVDDPLLKFRNLRYFPKRFLRLTKNTAASVSKKIVVIGSTDTFLGDTQATPLGPMSGMYLIVNGLNLFLEGRQLKKPALWLLIIIEGLTVLLSAIVFLFLSPPMAAIVLGVSVWLAGTQISLWMFINWGVLLGVWLPIWGVGLHTLIADAERSTANWIKKRRGP